MENTHHVITNTICVCFALGSVGIVPLCSMPVSVHAADISGPHASGESSLASLNSAELPPVPVLTVSAGILPTSPLAFLDRFDEWVQRTIFSFGVRRLRAESALAEAAERIAELQVLESQGLRTAELDSRLLVEHGRRLELAARLVGEEFARGGRPVLLVREVTRTTIASLDALSSLLENDEDIPSADVGEGEVLDVDVRSEDALGVFAMLRALEDRVDTALFPNPAVIPNEVFHLIVIEKLARAERDVERVQNTLPRDGSPSFVVAGDELVRTARDALTHARTLHLSANDREALTFTREIRDIALWFQSGALEVRSADLAKDPRAAARIEWALDDLAHQGLLTTADLASARERFLSVLSQGRE